MSWETTTLGDLCRIEMGGTPPRKEAANWDSDRSTDNVWLSIADMPETLNAVVSDSKEYLSDIGAARVKTVPQGTLMVSFKLTLGRLAFAGRELRTNEAIAALHLKDVAQVSKEYLYWYLTFFDWDEAASADHKVKGKTLNKKKLQALPVLVPPLDEQRHIVVLLDKAFAALDTAIANTEKNLANAEKLFLSTLRKCFEEPTDDWVVEPIFPTVKFIDYRGKTPPKTEGGIRLVTAKNVKFGYVQHEPREYVDPSAYDSWMTRGIPQPGDVLFTTEAPLGNVAQLDGAGKVVVGQRLITMQPDPELLRPAFLKYMLLSEPLQKAIWARATGATVQGIKAKLLKQVPIRYPQTVAEQDEIVSLLDTVWATKERLCEAAESKLRLIHFLKQSLLQRAFSGEMELSAGPSETATPQFTAQVIAFAYAKHKAELRDLSFRKVKAQKILHTAESISGIDLGRQPMKDAAAPNDFPHMLKAEEWAEATGFFKFEDAGDGGYRFRPLANFQSKLADADSTLAPYKDKLASLISIFLPMNKEQSEVFATVHAAWNNLIINGAEITDDAICYEARENWHPDKLKISKSKFYDAIRLIRQKGVEPDGSGKYVGGQESLF